jgi:hypothetical protein
MWRVCCLRELLFETSAIGVVPACIFAYSAAVCWHFVELCVLIYFIVIMYDVLYRILEARKYFDYF